MRILTLADGGGGGCKPPMSFSEIDAEPLGRTR